MIKREKQGEEVTVGRNGGKKRGRKDGKKTFAFAIVREPPTDGLDGGSFEICSSRDSTLSWRNRFLTLSVSMASSRGNACCCL